MICANCGGYVEWKGPITSLTHTQCLGCGGMNCQLRDDPMPDPDPMPHTVMVYGLPITEGMQTLFSGYSGGQAVVGIAPIRDGIVVSFADGSLLNFMPVPGDGCLVAKPDGTFEARR